MIFVTYGCPAARTETLASGLQSFSSVHAALRLLQALHGTQMPESFNVRRYTVITDKCIQDLRCVSVCPRNAIHPTATEAGFHAARQLFINPRRCIGCGSCMSACQTDAIFEIADLPSNMLRFAEVNAAYYAQ